MKTETYKIGDEVRIDLGRDRIMEGTLTSLRKINGDGTFVVGGTRYFSHQLPTISMNDDSIVYNPNNERRSR